MSYETKMYSQIAKAESFNDKDHRKYQAYELAATYAAKTDITNKTALIIEITKKSKAAYAAYI